jgi:hypothetical protein
MSVIPSFDGDNRQEFTLPLTDRCANRNRLGAGSITAGFDIHSDVDVARGAEDGSANAVPAFTIVPHDYIYRRLDHRFIAFVEREIFH